MGLFAEDSIYLDKKISTAFFKEKNCGYVDNLLV